MEYNIGDEVYFEEEDFESRIFTITKIVPLTDLKPAEEYDYVGNVLIYCTDINTKKFITFTDDCKLYESLRKATPAARVLYIGK